MFWCSDGLSYRCYRRIAYTLGLIFFFFAFLLNNIKTKEKSAYNSWMERDMWLLLAWLLDTNRKTYMWGQIRGQISNYKDKKKMKCLWQLDGERYMRLLLDTNRKAYAESNCTIRVDFQIKFKVSHILRAWYVLKLFLSMMHIYISLWSLTGA